MLVRVLLRNRVKFNLITRIYKNNFAWMIKQTGIMQM